ncbi:MAG: aminotransferase class I/II-fold pyridoxal phosphate-dependent enzyme, partial [Sphingomonadaceae bacterium]|nr:aminotransferase class I/II-fold pyridoxal phosphate-dependent enzyme [Sphingomonadaceae bacterium]
IDLLRQRARPYLFSNALAPGLVGASLKMFEMLGDNGLRETLRANAARFRKGMTEAGFDLIPGEHPIIPVMLGEARLAGDMAAALLAEGVFVTGFSFPVVPRGAARIRTQMSAAHTADQVDFAVDAFTRVGRKLGVI